MATKTKKTTKKSTTSAKTSRNNTKTTTKSAKKLQPTQRVATSFGWRIFWVIICVVVTSCLLIAVDDAIFGTNDRLLADYSSEQIIPVGEEASIPTSISWEELVTQQLAKDIFVPIAWGTLFTLVEAFILYKARLLNRSATSAILIAALWLLPITLAVIRLVSCYAFTYQIVS